MKRNSREPKNFPDRPGVYLFKDAKGKIIYVGKAKSLAKRVSSYFRQPIDSPKTQALVSNYRAIDFIVTPTELEALLLENKLIKQYQPKYNIQWRDDKNYPYIKLTTNEEWPRLLIVRKKENDQALYFGPYNAQSVKETIRLLYRLFPIRSCIETPMKIRSAPCLKYHIKRCFAPCIGKISKEQYHNFCRAIAKLLSGNLESAVAYLKGEMQAASAAQKFEAAARLRDRIKSLERIGKEKPGWQPPRRVIEGDPSLYELRNLLGLKRLPRRIEAFDVSNIQGKNPAASLVVFENGAPLKRDYRRFIIRSVEQPNDVASIEEVVFRRYAKSLKKELANPELILIDGGIAQARAAFTALKKAKAKIPVIGLAKKEEKIYFPYGRPPLALPADSGALNLLQRMRDEAHRFALSLHRKRRSKEVFRRLDNA